MGGYLYCSLNATGMISCLLLTTEMILSAYSAKLRNTTCLRLIQVARQSQ